MRRVGLWLASGTGFLLLLLCSARPEAALGLPAPPVVDSKAAARPAPGRLLVARRNFLDPFFSRSVILLLQHDAHASFGLIINQPRTRQLASAIPDFLDSPFAELQVSHGGPVGPGMLVILLRSPAAAETARHVTGDIYASINPQLLLDLPDGAASGDRLRLFLGHVGWTPGQLVAEIERGYWHVVDADPAIVFGAAAADLWESMIRSLEPASADMPDAPAW